MAIKSFVIEVPEVGTFEIRKMTIGLQQKIQLQYSRLTEGEDQYLGEADRATAWYLAYLKCAIISKPDGWDLEDLDIAEAYDQLLKIFNVINEKESLFRSKPEKEPEKDSKGTS